MFIIPSVSRLERRSKLKIGASLRRGLFVLSSSAKWGNKIWPNNQTIFGQITKLLLKSLCGSGKSRTDTIPKANLEEVHAYMAEIPQAVTITLTITKT